MLDLSFQYPAWFLIFCALLGLGYALLLYYRDTTFRDQAPKLNLWLGLLRWLSITLLSALLLSPLLKSFFTETKKPIVVLAQDQSESVATDLQGESFERYKQDWSALKNSLSENYEVHELAFGDQVREGVDFQFKDKVSNFSSQFTGEEIRLICAQDPELGKVENLKVFEKMLSYLGRKQTCYAQKSNRLLL
jgi:hypothetical protein